MYRKEAFEILGPGLLAREYVSLPRIGYRLYALGEASENVCVGSDSWIFSTVCECGLRLNRAHVGTRIANAENMSRKYNYAFEPKYLRDTLRSASAAALELHAVEEKLVKILREIDGRRIYLRYGYRSLRTYVWHDLGITEVQAQRLVTKVRRIQTIPDSRQMDDG
jgi:hypothetical protein